MQVPDALPALRYHVTVTGRLAKNGPLLNNPLLEMPVTSCDDSKKSGKPLPFASPPSGTFSFNVP